jgi:pyruvate dehydrogenase E2 component (dihydrolipoamide acetyltransferase)
MSEEILMLALSPTMETGTIVKWHKKEGEVIRNGEVLCEVETDKATMEYESQSDGTLLKIVVGEGGEAAVGQPIAVAGEKGEDISSLLQKKPEEQRVKKPPAEPPEEPAEKPLQETVPAVEESKEVAGVSGEPEERLPEGVKASPLVRKLAQQRGVELKEIAGSGPGGRIVKRDLDKLSKPPAGETAAPAPIGVPREIPFSAKRKVIAKRLSESMYSAPHYYLTAVAKVDGLVRSRKMLNERMDRKVSFNAFLIRFAAEALKRHPMVNASFKEENILQFGSADIGLAVAQPDGLIAPVVRDCWNKGIVRIDKELRELVGKALKGGLKPEEFSGATFTISNLGSFGIRDFTAIINPPGSAILAVGEIRKEAFEADEGKVSFRSVMNLTLSCDHRVIDGAIGAEFLSDLKNMIENPIAALY